ncbi:MAG TPA: DUF1657 domain-containing protein [Bacilli bacterium]|nr:DUF1657 domain-containing protein [Bacilli bacterium]
MTVSTKLQQTIAATEGVAANLRQFALDTEDQQAKEMFNQTARYMDNTVVMLKSRLQYVQQEEPQYRQ